MLLRVNSFVVSFVSFFALMGCSDSTGTAAPSSPPPPSVQRVELEVALGSSLAGAVGVTVCPTTGVVYLLDAGLGLYSMTDDLEFEQVATPETLYRVNPSSLYTDVAALGDDKFAITALNDGFLFDLKTGSIQQHFCYVPGFLIIGPTPPMQLTDGVAFDPITQRIIAQPVTIDAQTRTAINSEVGTFPITGGEGNDWHPIPDPQFLAGAIAVDAQGMLWLGRGHELFRYDLDTNVMELGGSLEPFAVDTIVGMAFDGDRLLVVDARQTLVLIPLALLQL